MWRVRLTQLSHFYLIFLRHSLPLFQIAKNSETGEEDAQRVSPLPPPPPVNVEDLLPLPQVLEITEWTLDSSQVFIRNARECQSCEEKKMKDLAMATRLCLRHVNRESHDLQKYAPVSTAYNVYFFALFLRSHLNIIDKPYLFLEKWKKLYFS